MKQMILMMTVSLCLLVSGCGGDDSSNSAPQGTVAALQAQLTEVQEKLTVAQTQQQAADDGIATAIAALTDVHETLSKLAETAANPKALKSVGNQVLALQSLVDSITARGNEVTNAYNRAQTGIAELTRQLADANAKVADLTARLAAAGQGNNSELTTQLADARIDITTLTNQITGLETAKASLQKQLDDANGTIGVRGQTIKDLNDEIAALEATIASMTATQAGVTVSASAQSAVTDATVTITATFPDGQKGKAVSFSANGGTLSGASSTIDATGTATATFSAAAKGAYVIHAVSGSYFGFTTVTIDPVRFTDNTDGTITDNITGLVWLANANCHDTLPGVTFFSAHDTTTSYILTWSDANTWAQALYGDNTGSKVCGLSDGSHAGDWRLPTVQELQSLTDFANSNPALPTGYSSYFRNVSKSSNYGYYWSSSSVHGFTNYAWLVYMLYGSSSDRSKTSKFCTWPVRNGL